MKHWLRSLSRGKQIAIGVLLAHAGVVLFLFFGYLLQPAPKIKHKVVVNTVRISPSPPPTPKLAPQPQKKAPAPPTKKAKPSPKPAPEALLKKIESQFDAILSSPEPTRTEISIPKLSEPLRVEPEPAPSSDSIAQFLQEALTLPEYGEVKAQLTIDRFGRLQQLNILEAKNEKNAEYLRNRLPGLRFPCLNEGASLTIVFSNAL